MESLIGLTRQLPLEERLRKGKTTSHGSGPLQGCIKCLYDNGKRHKGKQLPVPPQQGRTKQTAKLIDHVFFSLLYPQASKHFHFFKNESRKMTTI